jgi:hypothetical protein
MPLPGRREALFEGAEAAAALAGAETAAALAGAETAAALAGAETVAALAGAETVAALTARFWDSPHVCRSMAGTMPTWPVFQGIGSTSACDSGIPSARTLPARLTPACSWPWG